MTSSSAPLLGLVVLAAGAGTRLGGVAKALLRLCDGRTFLHAIVDTAREVGLDDALVVVGPPFGDEVASHARVLGCAVVVNPEPARGMSSSVALGFQALAASACQAAWLWPVDHPAVRASTLRALIAALEDRVAVRPVYRRRGGHPPLVARPAWARLAMAAGVEGGARAILGDAGLHDVEVDDAGCVRDVDTADALEELRP